MKRVFIFISVCFLAMSFYSCRLGNHKIWGVIMMHDTATGDDYQVDNATIELINVARTNIVTTTTSTEYGQYEINRISQGTYTLHAYKTINGIKHEGVSDKFVLTDGVDMGVDVLLQ